MGALKKSELRTDNFPQKQHVSTEPLARIDGGGVHYSTKAVSWVKGLIVALAVMAFGAFNSVAQAAVTIPDTGVDMDEWVTAAITGLGAIVVVVIGGYFAFKLIKLCLRWVGRIGG